jgi:hypothetical protein
MMNGCIERQSPLRLPNRRLSRSIGRSQERLPPACLRTRTLDGEPMRRLSDNLLNRTLADLTHCQIEY